MPCVMCVLSPSVRPAVCLGRLFLPLCLMLLLVPWSWTVDLAAPAIPRRKRRRVSLRAYSSVGRRLARMVASRYPHVCCLYAKHTFPPAVGGGVAGGGERETKRESFFLVCFVLVVDSAVADWRGCCCCPVREDVLVCYSWEGDTCPVDVLSAPWRGRSDVLPRLFVIYFFGMSFFPLT